MNLPTYLTLVRIGSIPFIAVLYYLPFTWAHPLAVLVFIIASLTDWLDGYLARRMEQTTKLGSLLDTVADKLLVAVILVLVLGHHQMAYLSLPAAVIIGREISISALREWMAELGKRATVSVLWVAKVKTTVQLIALILLLWYHPGSPAWLLLLGSVTLYASAVLTIWSMVEYIKLAWPDLTLHAEQE